MQDFESGAGVTKRGPKRGVAGPAGTPDTGRDEMWACVRDRGPGQASLASEEGGFEEGPASCRKQLQDMNPRHADHDIA